MTLIEKLNEAIAQAEKERAEACGRWKLNTLAGKIEGLKLAKKLALEETE